MTPLRLALVALALAPAGLRAADVDPLVPADTENYLSINVKAALASPFFEKDLVGALKEQLAAAGVSEVFADLGLDPLKDVHRVLFASPAKNDNDRGLVIVHGTFDRAKFEKRAERAVKDDAEMVKVHEVKLGADAAKVWEVVISGQDMSVFVALLGDKTLVASGGKDYVVDALKQHRAKKKADLKNKAFQALVESLDPRQTVSLAVLGKSIAAAFTDKMPAAITDAVKDVEAVGGGLTVTNEVKLDLLVTGKDAASAESIRKAMDKGVKLGMVGLALLAEGRKELEVLLEVVKTVKVGGKGKVVAVSARLTADVLKDFFEKGE